jgi:cytoskeletal protein RodZ
MGQTNWFQGQQRQRSMRLGAVLIGMAVLFGGAIVAAEGMSLASTSDTANVRQAGTGCSTSAADDRAKRHKKNKKKHEGGKGGDTTTTVTTTTDTAPPTDTTTDTSTTDTTTTDSGTTDTTTVDTTTTDTCPTDTTTTDNGVGNGVNNGGTTTCTASNMGSSGMTGVSGMFPVGSTVQITNPTTGRSVDVRITGRSSGCVAMSGTAFAMVAGPGEILLPGAKIRLLTR